MQNKYVIDGESIDILRSRFVLIDTNFLIDASLFPSEALALLESLNSLGCELVVTRTVLTEFLGGTKSETDLQAKIALLESVLGESYEKISHLSAPKDFPPRQSILKFSRQCRKFASADFELFLTLERYKNSSLLLLTRNHNDFTNKLFCREGFITLLGNTEIRTYGLYSIK